MCCSRLRSYECSHVGEAMKGIRGSKPGYTKWVRCFNTDEWTCGKCNRQGDSSPGAVDMYHFGRISYCSNCLQLWYEACQVPEEHRHKDFINV